MSDNRCVYCGEIIPEGRQVCPTCEKIQTETKSAEKFCWVLDNWIVPIGIAGLIVLFFILVR